MKTNEQNFSSHLMEFFKVILAVYITAQDKKQHFFSTVGIETKTSFFLKSFAYALHEQNVKSRAPR